MTGQRIKKVWLLAFWEAVYMMTIKGVNLIAGKESHKGTTTFRSINPTTDEQSKIAFTNATNDEIGMA